MTVLPDTGRDFWRTALVAGGSTQVPRWTRHPMVGTARHDQQAPEELVRAVRALATEQQVAVGAVLMAAHAKVLTALSGEQEVVTGYLAAGHHEPLPCRLSTTGDTWRALLQHAGVVEAAIGAHLDVPVDVLRRELGAVQSFETELLVADQDTHPDDMPLAAGTVLRVTCLLEADRLVVSVLHRTESLDAEAAARIAGYHLAALTQLSNDPEARHREQTLLSADELRLQVEGLAGPVRDLPDRRVHQLFEDRVREHPDAVAARYAGAQCTYAELNSRANRLARALLARGLRREGVVAVVTERNLDWLTAVLAVFKAGGVYLPVEPHFPADRIARTLHRAGCVIALSEAGSTGSLERALVELPAVNLLLVDAAGDEGHSDEDLDVEVEADQLAYIYFTSGSTGEPKGAMCEHAGFLNHVFAKLDDLQITDDPVVAQTAPQCFDISLWQLVAGLVVGGRTVLVEQQVILDVERFVDTLEREQVSVVQLVPSYLEVVLSYLEEHPRELPALTCVSATGEALKRELVQRWFDVMPGIKLVNAYGLTETSDDTNHEVMDRVPDLDRVPLGRPVNNVRIYVVDDQLVPVPLGAPGAIVFSGVCVGRGYVNDPERTRQAYLTDPYQPGQRLYQGGDFGRWLADGKLDFLGRRDTQVKISGFRIEIGEIDNTLLRVPGVRDGAVVAVDRPGRGKQLVAFYSGPEPVHVGELQQRLGASLPGYMVPTAFHWQGRLPLTANGKIDTKSLVGLAVRLDAEVDAQPAAGPGEDADRPTTPSELRLAAAWAKVLGVPSTSIGRRDHFFDRGGTSLSAVKLAIAMERTVSLRDVTSHPVLADLAARLDRGPASTGATPNPGLNPASNPASNAAPNPEEI